MPEGRSSGRDRVSGAARATDPALFRAEFPVLERLSYLNAGTEGPVPAKAADAARERIRHEAEAGRTGKAYHEEIIALADRLRAGYAALLGAAPEHVALTGSTTDGVNTILSGLDLRAGEEILTSDEEHPGLLAPLGRARIRHGVEVRVVPFAELPGEVRSSTRLIACSHISWVGGKVMDIASLRATGVPILLDAAQAIGAIPLDLPALEVDFYAASGQKWLCGPEGSGCLYVRPERLQELLIPWPGYGSLEDSALALELAPAAGSKRLDHGYPPGVRSTWALASLGVFGEAGWPWVHERARSLAASLAAGLRDRGLQVTPRGDSTLVAWHSADAEAEVERLAAEGILVRSIPAQQMVRASVGAWSSEEELQRLVARAG